MEKRLESILNLLNFQIKTDTKWCLQLFPRGERGSKSHFLALYLKCCSASLTAEFPEVKCLFKLSILDAEGKETNIKEDDPEDDTWTHLKVHLRMKDT